MKRRIVWPIILVPFLVIGLIFTVGCEEQEQPDIPRYTADQVIAVAQANSPTFPATIVRQGYNEKPAWSAEYLGEGVWLVKKYAVHTLTNVQVNYEGWYFHENNGQINKSRY